MALVVLDAANVATVSPGNLQAERLRAALECFARMDVRAVAFAPRYWLDGNQLFRDDAGKAIIQALVNENKLVLTPPQAHDDFYVIDYATKHNGFVVTNDMFRDHIMNKRRFNGEVLTTAWVKSHCIDFTFVLDEFLPNSQMMDMVLRKNVAAPPVAPTTSTTLTTTLLPETKSNDLNTVDHSHDMVIEDMAPERSNTLRKVDMSEAVYIQVPMEIVVVLHANDDAGLKYFMVLDAYTDAGMLRQL
ncbi:hypothetical protein ACHHYP_07224 [Achlya hypogyna]|uniref:RNase NYN domain-containing protein n=1 Tax=Achlya hypogyna TaxID=1202772 RepID=A0A1V9ZMN2_ACHHY|nr:hypothetical protein ACHHYP_07224 [Achlya hypogyna]